MLLGLLCVIESMYKYKCSRVWMMEDEGGYKNMQLIKYCDLLHLHLHLYPEKRWRRQMSKKRRPLSQGCASPKTFKRITACRSVAEKKD